MSIFPVNTYKVRSLAKPSEILAVLSKYVQPLPVVIRLREHKTFAGSVSEAGFQFIRVGERGNSFRPTIYGTFSSDSEFTLLHITIRPGAYFFISLIFMFLIFTMVIYNVALLPLLVGLFSNNPQEIQMYLSPPYLYYLLFPIIALFLGYLFGVAFFDGEAYLAERELSKALESFFIKTETVTHDK